ncbi:MAG TPA: hypothetical protein VLM75_11805 [Spirochaetota bacterium]|nr:hypothetical protein [Spirochaetota bacterium]
MRVPVDVSIPRRPFGLTVFDYGAAKHGNKDADGFIDGGALFRMTTMCFFSEEHILISVVLPATFMKKTTLCLSIRFHGAPCIFSKCPFMPHRWKNRMSGSRSIPIRGGGTLRNRDSGE